MSDSRYDKKTDVSKPDTFSVLFLGHTATVRNPNVRISALFEMVPISDVRFFFSAKLDRFIYSKRPKTERSVFGVFKYRLVVNRSAFERRSKAKRTKQTERTERTSLD